MKIGEELNDYQLYKLAELAWESFRTVLNEWPAIDVPKSDSQEDIFAWLSQMVTVEYSKLPRRDKEAWKYVVLRVIDSWQNQSTLK